MWKYLLFIITFCAFSGICTAQSPIDSSHIAKTIYKEYSTKDEQKTSIQELKEEISQLQNTELTFILYYHLARFNYLHGNIEVVIQYSEKAQNTPIQKAYYKAKLYNLRGAAYSVNAEYEKAIQQMVKAMKIYDNRNDEYNSAIIKNNIANIFISIRDYQSAYEYSLSAYNNLKSIKDTALLPQITGILAITNTHQDSTDRSDQLIKQSIHLSKKYNNKLGTVIGYYAYGDYYNAIEQHDSAIEKFKYSLKISQRLQLKQYETFNKIGLLNSYSHIEEYDSAVHYGEQALNESIAANNQNTLFSIYKNLGRSYAGNEEYLKAYDYTYKAEQLFESLASKKNIEAINETLIKYQTEKKEKEIIAQQLEIVKKEKQVIQRSRWLYFLIGIILIGILLFFWLREIYITRIQKLKTERKKAIKEAIVEGENKERERLASELHDSIASGVTGIKLQLEYTERNFTGADISKSINELNRLHQDIRRISHNLYPSNLHTEHILIALKNLISRQPNAPTQFVFKNLINETINFTLENKKIILQIAQELIHNVHKHAQAKNCKVQVSKMNNEMVLTVEDDGIGINKKINETGIGLQSIQKRVDILQGQLTIEQSEQKGTLVIIYIPIS